MTGTALITGITGQDGSYLAELLLEKGYEVVGLHRRSSTVTFERISHLTDRLTLVPADLLDEASMIRVLRDHRPTEVYNLAAQSFVQTSFAQPILTGEVTGPGRDPAARRHPAHRPDHPLLPGQLERDVRQGGRGAPDGAHAVLPRSPYGVAKVYGHWITVNYRESYGLHASSGILFNHESPRRGLEFVTRKVTFSAAAIKLGLQKTVSLGNLDAQRDWGFAADYVRAMWLMLQQDEPGDYVVATGETHSVRELCQIAFDHVGLNWEDHVVVDEQFFRPAEVDLLIGDPSKARDKLGWKPEVGFEELVRMMVDADLAALRRG